MSVASQKLSFHFSFLNAYSHLFCLTLRNLVDWAAIQGTRARLEYLYSLMTRTLLCNHDWFNLTEQYHKPLKANNKKTNKKPLYRHCRGPPLPINRLIWALVSFSTRSPSLATSLRTHMKGRTSLMRLDSSSSSSLSAVSLMQVKTYPSGSPSPQNRASLLAFFQTIWNKRQEG